MTVTAMNENRNRDGNRDRDTGVLHSLWRQGSHTTRQFF